MPSFIENIKAQMLNENVLGVKEDFYIEISVRDARQAQEIIRDIPYFKNLEQYGSNVYATDDEEQIQELLTVLEDNSIEILDSITEMSTTAGVPGYQTPYAFGKQDDEDVEILGFKKVKKSNVNESKFMQLSKQMHLNEISYHEYKKDPTVSAKKKVNQSISEINKRIREIERVVNHNVRLKREMGVNSGQYWKSSQSNLSKINERLLRISKQLKELAS